MEGEGKKRFAYSEISSLILPRSQTTPDAPVITTSRRKDRFRKEDDDYGGEENDKNNNSNNNSGTAEAIDAPQSLWGKIDTREMGVRASRESAPKESTGSVLRSQKKTGVLGLKFDKNDDNIDHEEDDDEFDAMHYRPKTKESRQAYEYLLALVTKCSREAVSLAELRDMVDEVIKVVRDPEEADSAKRHTIQHMLDLSVSAGNDTDRFSQLVQLCQRLNDYGTPPSTNNGPSKKKNSDNVISGDEEQTVALIVDEEDQDDAQMMVIEEEEPEEGQDEGEEGPLVVSEQQAAERKLEELVFPALGHTMTNRKCHLPEGSVRKPGRDYEEIIIPPPPSKSAAQQQSGADEWPLVSVAELPEWMQGVFAGLPSLNRIQSRVAPCLLHTDQNVLVAAPTGAGKTVIALLAMLRALSKAASLDSFRCVYLAPMRALVQEQVREFEKRLGPLG